jgi:hypothetical protein
MQLRNYASTQVRTQASKERNLRWARKVSGQGKAINQLMIHQSINQSINQRINQSFIHSIND